MKKRNQLGSRIILIIMAIFAVILAMTIYMMAHNSKQSVQSTIAERTIEIATNMTTFLDAEEYATLLANPSENDLYWKLREQLNSIREYNGVLYAYTFFVPEPGEQVRFLVDGMPVDDIENAGALGEEPRSTTYAHVEDALNNGRVTKDL